MLDKYNIFNYVLGHWVIGCYETALLLRKQCGCSKTLGVCMVQTGVWCFLAVAKVCMRLPSYNQLANLYHMVLCCQMLAISVLLLFHTIPFVRVTMYTV